MTTVRLIKRRDAHRRTRHFRTQRTRGKIISDMKRYLEEVGVDTSRPETFSIKRKKGDENAKVDFSIFIDANHHMPICLQRSGGTFDDNLASILESIRARALDVRRGVKTIHQAFPQRVENDMIQEAGILSQSLVQRPNGSHPSAA